MTRFVFLAGLMFWVLNVCAQTNIMFTTLETEQIVKGNYDPTAYQAAQVVSDHKVIINKLNQRVSADSLQEYIVQLAAFKNRNTGADTTSLTEGMGATRRWIHSKFQEFSMLNEGRLRPAYLQFDQDICGMGQHRNVVGVLPGSDTSIKEVIIIEGHMDSRCDGNCDINCVAEGVEDNASGTALVMELARVMSKYTFKRTIVFMTTTGEEQGLHGATALARYCFNNKIKVKAVLNNDVIGGVICGKTSSEPSCPGENLIDSTQVRIFSYGGFNSSWKQLARYVKLQYQEELLPLVSVPMDITIMTLEDRIGRGGDHIPFRRNGFASVRFTSAHEHGNVNVSDPNYEDRQHTSNDILGVDTNNDGKVDSFFVDFNYLARNAVINATGATTIAQGPRTPNLSLTAFHGRRLVVQITDETQYPMYRVAVRSRTNDWDTVYTTMQLLDTFYPADEAAYMVSVASVDDRGIESLFSREVMYNATGVVALQSKYSGLQLLQNKPNPFDMATTIGVLNQGAINYEKAEIEIRDIQGKLVQVIPISLDQKINEVTFSHGYGKMGTYVYTLMVDGKPVDSKQMIFAN